MLRVDSESSLKFSKFVTRKELSTGTAISKISSFLVSAFAESCIHTLEIGR